MADKPRFFIRLNSTKSLKITGETFVLNVDTVDIYHILKHPVFLCDRILSAVFHLVPYRKEY